MATVTAVEIKTTAKGNPYKGCKLADGRSVNVFDNHPLYPDVETGFDIPDTLFYQKGQYWNLSDPSRGPRKSGGNSSRSADIKEAQDRKEQSIAFFNATNASITLVSTMMSQQIGDDAKELQRTIRFWRDWFLAEHDSYKNHTERYPEADPLKEEKKEEEDIGPIDW